MCTIEVSCVLQKERREKQKKSKENEVPKAVMQMNKYVLCVYLFGTSAILLLIYSPSRVGADSTKKRSKLVLPAPQISDAELEEVVKLGQASEEAQSFAGDEEGASQHLLADYSMTPSLGTPALRTPRTPASEDTILQEVQTIIALQNVQTPLKGSVLNASSIQ